MAFASGGLATFTGPAWLDGTKKRPERVLSAVQTELFERMVHSLEQTGGGSLGVTIGQITIQTPQLNTNADFGAAGQTLAKALKEAIGERGININKKK